MTQDEIIRMAREAGFKTENWTNCAHISVCANGVEIGIGDKLKHFAALVAAHERERIEAQLKAIRPQGKSWLPMVLEAVLAEREACAKVCEEISQDHWNLYKGRPPYTGSETGRADPHEQGVSMGASDCATAIRARGQK